MDPHLLFPVSDASRATVPALSGRRISGLSVRQGLLSLTTVELLVRHSKNIDDGKSSAFLYRYFLLCHPIHWCFLVYNKSAFPRPLSTQNVGFLVPILLPSYNISMFFSYAFPSTYNATLSHNHAPTPLPAGSAGTRAPQGAKSQLSRYKLTPELFQLV